MNIVYDHLRYASIDGKINPKGGITFAIEEISVEFFSNITEDHVLVAKFGVATCSKKDLYNKSIGRKIAKGRMVDTEFEVISINNFVNKDGQEIKFIYLTNGDTMLRLAHKENSRFVIAEVCKDG